MLLFMDGFDHYNYNGTAHKKWNDPVGNTSGFTSVTTGRFGTGGMRPNGSGNLFFYQWIGAEKTFSGSHDTMIIGMACQFDYTVDAEHPFLQLMGNNGQPQIQFWLNNPGGDISVRLAATGALAIPVVDATMPAGTLIANTGFIPPVGLWFYLEVKVVHSTTGTGSITIHVDSTPLATYSAINTANSGVTTFSGWRVCGLKQFDAGYTVDDVYMADTTTGNVTDFTDEVRVQTKYADAEGFQNDWLPATGTNNALMVNLTKTSWVENGNPAKYNFSGTINAIDLYSVENFTVAGTIFGVQVNLSHRKDDVGVRRVAPIVRTNSNIYVGTDKPQYSDYTYAGYIWEINPALAVAWNLTELNQAEFGIKITA